MEMRELLRKKNVVAVVHGDKEVKGVKTGRPAIVVYVTQKVALDQLSTKDIIPEKIQGLETDVQISKKIVALAFDRTKKWRPAPSGVSAGHFNITCGSTGPVVKKDKIRHSLSNNHIYADSNNAQIHDPIYQPGPHDGGTSDDIIGHLAAFVPINFIGDGSTCLFAKFLIWCANGLAKGFHRYSRFNTYSSVVNKVDCATIRPLLDTDITDEILEIGVPAGFNLSELKKGDVLRKSGRTTGVTQGTVIDTQGLANVFYGDKLASFEDQVVATAMAEGGDSGSPVVNDKNEVVGLLFGGSDTLTIINKIGNVIDALGLDK